MSIELKNVSKNFGEVTAVRDEDFSVREGELMALLGPSGGGKTTVLRMIAGLEMPSEGDIFINGERVNDVPVQKRNIGFVFQNYALFKNMSVFKNIAFGLKIKKWKKPDIEARVDELLKLLGLAGLERRYPHQLSGGQRQRVAIARAIAIKPQVVLLDEPTSALDPEMTAEVLELIEELKREGRDLLLVTHEMGFARRLADRVALLADGRIAEFGPPEQIFGAPESAVTKGFLSRVLRY